MDCYWGGVYHDIGKAFIGGFAQTEEAGGLRGTTNPYANCSARDSGSRRHQITQRFTFLEGGIKNDEQAFACRRCSAG